MNYPIYDLSSNSNSTIFSFISTGVHGDISKLIRYTITSNDKIYNLGFGNKIIINKEESLIDDLVITDNGDRDIILATVAKTTYIFTEQNPDKYVLFRGSTPSRTRLYRMAITKNYNELSKTFHIFGVHINSDGQLIDAPFDSNVDFDGFIIKRK